MHKRMPGGVGQRGMRAVIVAQFFSAFGDNALLFATLARLKGLHFPLWSQPALQMAFVAAYIVLAPFVGHVADGFAKGRVMMAANGLKLLGAMLIVCGLNPFIGYTLVGAGAAAYSPAKYGILGELTDGSRLVKANGVMEASTITAILMGSVAGGMLADWHVGVALIVCALFYAVALLANAFIPRLPVARQITVWRPGEMLAGFAAATRTLWHHPQARFSLAGTSLFWGAGVTLRFLLVLWVPRVLGLTDNTTPTLLNAMVAVGIVAGAAAAGRLVTLGNVQRCMPAGMLIGLLVVMFSLQHSLVFSYLLLLLVGLCGGFFVVPLNALLQQCGRESVGAGHAIAVQNLGENVAMLLMLAGYSLAIRHGVSVVGAGAGFGLLFALTIVLVWRWGRR